MSWGSRVDQTWLPFLLSVPPSGRGGSLWLPFLLQNRPQSYPYARGLSRVIHFRHRWQRRRLGVRRTHTVTWQSSHHQVDPPLGDISVDLRLEDGRIGVHERLVLVDRDMGDQVAQRQRFVRLKAEILAQPALPLLIAEGVLR